LLKILQSVYKCSSLWYQFIGHTSLSVWCLFNSQFHLWDDQ